MASQNGHMTAADFEPDSGKLIDGTGVQKADGNTIYMEFGSTGLDAMLLRTLERLPKIKGKTARDVYQRMADDDPTVGSILFAIEMMLRQVEWIVEPAEVQEGQGSAINKAIGQAPAGMAMRIAEHVQSCLHDLNLSWEDLLSQILTMLPHGWAWFEIVYKRRLGPDPGRVIIDNPDIIGGKLEFELPASRYDDGLVGWRKVAYRPQDTLDDWDIDETGGIKGMWQIAPPDYKKRYMAIGKSLLFRTKALNNNPEGRSVLRTAVRPWWHKLRIENIEAVGVERDLAGLPKAFAPSNWFMDGAADDEKKALQSIQDAVRNIKRDENEGITLPSIFDEHGNRQVDIELMNTGGKREFDTNNIIGRYRQEIATTMLADFILLGQNSVGSRALSDPKITLFHRAIGSWLDAIAAVFNDHAIPRLVRMNGWDPALSPKLKPGDITEIDLGVLGEYVAKMAQAGFMWALDEAADTYLRQAAKIPVAETTSEL